MGKKILLLLASCAVAVLSADAVRAESFKFMVFEDSWVNQANPDAAYGGNTYLSVKDRSGCAEAYLRFSDGDMASLKGYTISDASLWLYQYQSTYSPGDSVTVRRVNSGWNEDSVSWNSRPAVAGAPVCAMELDSGNECWRSFSGLGRLVGDWRDSGNFGLMLENGWDAQEGELFARFYSSEFSLERQPYLTVNAVKATPEPMSCVLFSLGGLAFSAVRKLRNVL